MFVHYSALTKLSLVMPYLAAAYPTGSFAADLATDRTTRWYLDGKRGPTGSVASSSCARIERNSATSPSLQAATQSHLAPRRTAPRSDDLLSSMLRLCVSTRPSVLASVRSACLRHSSTVTSRGTEGT
ncbi:hypothetical protein CONLIGDRAFT_357871 [Coniochaeta ligniaria NRRL 30616]|uniref:Secreted protein n=1 Tax=Coniochaeta ligniaria NRRL 30616 TaxID=1408157 RepID=A0A1J7JLD7_9PEZI|nr:hypothetical protein CONLIGDRAFT_357871 [Coniochaeta ligniaria NRRL 30616]